MDSFPKKDCIGNVSTYVQFTVYKGEVVFAVYISSNTRAFVHIKRHICYDASIIIQGLPILLCYTIRLTTGL